MFNIHFLWENTSSALFSHNYLFAFLWENTSCALFHLIIFSHFYVKTRACTKNMKNGEIWSETKMAKTLPFGHGTGSNWQSIVLSTSPKQL